jgi:hypothetical protein
MALGVGFSSAPSLIISAAPSSPSGGISSAGWKMNFTLPDLRACGQDAGHAHQDGDMAVMPAGVHDAHLLAVPDRAGLGREGQVHLLGDRQAVHVGPQRHHAAGPAALEQAHHAGVGHAGRTSSAQRRRCSATMAAVRNSRLPSSGCWCRSRRQAMT